MSLRYKTFILLFSISIVPILIIGMIEIKQNRQILERQIGTTSLEYAGLALERLNGYMYSKYEDILSWSHIVAFEDISKTSRYPYISDFLNHMVEIYGEYYYAIVLDEKGDVIASSSSNLLGKNFSSHPSFQQASRGKSSVQDVTFDPAAGGYAVIISHPIRHKTTTGEIKVVGVMYAAVMWEKINQVVTSLKISGRNQTIRDHMMLCNSDGLVISCFLPKELFKTNLVDIGMISAMNAIEKQEGFLFETSGHGFASFTAYTYSRKYKNLPDLGWSMVLLQNPNRVFSLVVLQKQKTISTLLILTTVLIIASFLFGKKISKPILVIASVAKAFGKGDLGSRVEVVSNDEVGVLADSFNKMAENIEQSEEEREKLLKTLAVKNEELESIVYVSSHDLRSPLINIQGYSTELRQSCKQAAEIAADIQIPKEIADQFSKLMLQNIPESLDYITSSAGKMDMLLTGLLKLSRLGRAALEIETLDIDAMIGEVIESMQFKIKESGAELTVDKLPPCLGDKTQINQVFTNLLDNAIKYLDPSRKGLVHIYGKVENAMSVYCVKDNGIGIAPQHHAKAFEIFHQLEPNEAQPGQGLGLTIAQRIVDRHKGKVWIESEAGKGSSFYITLPHPEDITG